MGHHHIMSSEQSSNVASCPSSTTIIDVHTHTYPPSYIDLLAKRTTVPYIHRPSDGSDPRLIILPSDDDQSKPPSKRGRPVDSSYSSWTEKVNFMKLHSISISVVSLANPWLDFLDPSRALTTAQQINDDLDAACAGQNGKNDPHARLYAFASLPLSACPDEITSEIRRLRTLQNIKGVILGTTGLGSGLDDPNMDPIWDALQDTETMIFLHPHYGLPEAAFGGAEVVARSGHVLPLALGFPLETTIAVTRMYLASVFDRFPRLKMLLAHSGGTLPFLAGRIQSCVDHEREFVGNGVGGDRQGPTRGIWDVLGTNIWLDAVVYSRAGLLAAVEAVGGGSGSGGNGADRVIFGTDHPFFPPLKGGEGTRWMSVDGNIEAVLGVDGASGGKREVARKILGGNAARALGIET